MTESETPAKKRKMRTTQNQYELYVSMLEKNKYFRENKVTPDHPNDLTECWENLVKNLNSSGGPKKSLTEWKRVFVDWKCQVRKRARMIKNSVTETGNRGEPERELLEIEKKLLYWTGEVVTEGIEAVPELGVHNDINVKIAVEQEKNKEQEKINEQQANPRLSKRNRDSNILEEINLNLKKLLELKKEEIQLMRIKLQLKYNVAIEDEAVV